MGKLFSFRRPGLSISTRGIRFRGPSARAGGAVGINVSKSGVSGSVQPSRLFKKSRRKSSGCLGCVIPIVLFALGVLFLVFIAI